MSHRSSLECRIEDPPRLETEPQRIEECAALVLMLVLASLHAVNDFDDQYEVISYHLTAHCTCKLLLLAKRCACCQRQPPPRKIPVMPRIRRLPEEQIFKECCISRVTFQSHKNTGASDATREATVICSRFSISY
jgi:hypothetical protein